MNEIDVLVLRKGTHGMQAKEYADALQERLPNSTIRLAETPKQEQNLASQARIITSVQIDDDLVENAENLELFAGVAAGYGHLPLDELASAGVSVTNASGIHAPNIAEQVLGYILMKTRRLQEGKRRQQRREWRHYQTDELKDSTLTIVGLGAIGTAIVQRVSAFEVETIGVRYTPEKGGPTDEVIGFDKDDFHEALAKTDHLILASPLTKTTRGLIDTAEFNTLPEDAYIVNVGRGQIVNTEPLLAAIRSNAIAGAALDVTDPEPLPQDHPLWNFDNVTITPHNAGHSPEHWERLADIVASNVRRLNDDAEPEELENLVRAPE